MIDRLLIRLLLIAMLIGGAWAVYEHIQEQDRELRRVEKLLLDAQAQTGLEQSAAEAEADLAARERVIYKEVDDGRAVLEAAMAMGRAAQLDAWAGAARRMRGEPEGGPAQAGAPAV